VDTAFTDTTPSTTLDVLMSGSLLLLLLPLKCFNAIVTCGVVANV